MNGLFSRNNRQMERCKKSRVERQGEARHMNVSYSRFNTYLSCPYKHYLAYEEGWQKKQKDRSLYFGTDFHKLLEYRTKLDKIDTVVQDITDRFYELPADRQADLGLDYPTDIFNIFVDYCEVYKDCPLPNETELEFNIPIGKYKGEPVVFKGFIDGVYFNNGDITVEEHKTFSKMPAKDFLVMNTQKSLYAVAIKHLYGDYPKTILWDYIHSQAAASPVWLEKSGRFSTANTNKVTPYSYQRACKERGVECTDSEKYEGNIVNFFFRTEMDYIPEMIEDVWDGFKYTCKDIVRNGKKNKTKNLTYNCSWCPYRDICHAELTGGNVEAILEKDFERREDGNTGSQEAN